MTLSTTFCLPEGLGKVEQQINNPWNFIRFGSDVVCQNGYQMKKCTNANTMDRIRFERYALQMHENRTKVAVAQVF